MKRFNVRKVFSSLLSVLFFLTNCALAHSIETGLWSDRQKSMVARLPVQMPPATPLLAHPSTITRHANSPHLPIILALSPTAGSIRKVLSGNSNGRKVVVHIQDVHKNAEAQANIAKTVQGLVDAKAIDLIALEGAFGPIDLSWFRNYPRQQPVKEVADFLFSENRVSGPVYSAFTSDAAIPPLLGIDDKTHYDANVAAVRAASVQAPALEAALADEARAIANQKRSTFNADLKKFDDRVEAFRAGHIDWGTYVVTLARTADHVSTKMESLLLALEMEKKMDFDRASRERSAMIAALVEKQSQSKNDELLAYGNSYRAGAVSHADFYAYIRGRCKAAGLELKNFPAFDNYMRYVLLSDSLDVEAIFTETDALEKSAYAALAATEEEKRLIETARRHYLTTRLSNFSLVRNEWDEYSSPWNVSIQGPLSDGKMDPGLRHSRMTALKPFEDFYREAEARDIAMVENVERALSKPGVNAAVLVTGGFHSEGMERALLEKGISVISYQPQITKIEDENGSAYLSMFTQKKTPLDKLFAGEKLFLADAPAPELAPIKKLVDLNDRLIATNGDTATETIGRYQMTVARDAATKSVKVRINPLNPFSLAFLAMLLTATPAIGAELLQQAKNVNFDSGWFAAFIAGLAAYFSYLWMAKNKDVDAAPSSSAANEIDGLLKEITDIKWKVRAEAATKLMDSFNAKDDATKLRILVALIDAYDQILVSSYAKVNPFLNKAIGWVYKNHKGELLAVVQALTRLMGKAKGDSLNWAADQLTLNFPDLEEASDRWAAVKALIAIMPDLSDQVRTDTWNSVIKTYWMDTTKVELLANFLSTYPWGKEKNAKGCEAAGKLIATIKDETAHDEALSLLFKFLASKEFSKETVNKALKEFFWPEDVRTDLLRFAHGSQLSGEHFGVMVALLSMKNSDAKTFAGKELEKIFAKLSLFESDQYVLLSYLPIYLVARISDRHGFPKAYEEMIYDLDAADFRSTEAGPGNIVAGAPRDGSIRYAAYRRNDLNSIIRLSGGASNIPTSIGAMKTLAVWVNGLAPNILYRIDYDLSKLIEDALDPEKIDPDYFETMSAAALSVLQAIHRNGNVRPDLWRLTYPEILKREHLVRALLESNGDDLAPINPATPWGTRDVPADVAEKIWTALYNDVAPFAADSETEELKAYFAIRSAQNFVTYFRQSPPTEFIFALAKITGSEQAAVEADKALKLFANSPNFVGTKRLAYIQMAGEMKARDIEIFKRLAPYATDSIPSADIVSVLIRGIDSHLASTLTHTQLADLWDFLHLIAGSPETEGIGQAFNDSYGRKPSEEFTSRAGELIRSKRVSAVDRKKLNAALNRLINPPTTPKKKRGEKKTPKAIWFLPPLYVLADAARASATELTSSHPASTVYAMAHSWRDGNLLLHLVIAPLVETFAIIIPFFLWRHMAAQPRHLIIARTIVSLPFLVSFFFIGEFGLLAPVLGFIASFIFYSAYNAHQLWNRNRWTPLILFIAAPIIMALASATSYADTIKVTPQQNIQEVFKKNGGGHTYVLADGKYGDIKDIPNGTKNAPTVVKAENVGKVQAGTLVIGSDRRGAKAAEYITVDGIRFYSKDGGAVSVGSPDGTAIEDETNNILLKRIFAQSGPDSSDEGVIGFGRVRDSAIEQSAARGSGRYTMMIYGSTRIKVKDVVLSWENWAEGSKKANKPNDPKFTFGIYDSHKTKVDGLIVLKLIKSKFDGEEGAIYLPGNSNGNTAPYTSSDDNVLGRVAIVINNGVALDVEGGSGENNKRNKFSNILIIGDKNAKDGHAIAVAHRAEDNEFEKLSFFNFGKIYIGDETGYKGVKTTTILGKTYTGRQKMDIQPREADVKLADILGQVNPTYLNELSDKSIEEIAESLMKGAPAEIKPTVPKDEPKVDPKKDPEPKSDPKTNPKEPMVSSKTNDKKNPGIQPQAQAAEPQKSDAAAVKKGDGNGLLIGLIAGAGIGGLAIGLIVYFAMRTKNDKPRRKYKRRDDLNSFLLVIAGLLASAANLNAAEEKPAEAPVNPQTRLVVNALPPVQSQGVSGLGALPGHGHLRAFYKDSGDVIDFGTALGDGNLALPAQASDAGRVRAIASYIQQKPDAKNKIYLVIQKTDAPAFADVVRDFPFVSIEAETEDPVVAGENDKRELFLPVVLRAVDGFQSDKKQNLVLGIDESLKINKDGMTDALWGVYESLRVLLTDFLMATPLSRGGIEAIIKADTVSDNHA